MHRKLRSSSARYASKVLLWQSAEEDLQMFQNLYEYMKEKDVNQQVATIVQGHFQSLSELFGRY